MAVVGTLKLLPVSVTRYILFRRHIYLSFSICTPIYHFFYKASFSLSLYNLSAVKRPRRTFHLHVAFTIKSACIQYWHFCCRCKLDISHFLHSSCLDKGIGGRGGSAYFFHVRERTLLSIVCFLTF